jgi:hypothetical protein
MPSGKRSLAPTLTSRTRSPGIRSTFASSELGSTTTSSMFPFRSSRRRQLGPKHPPPSGSIGWALPNCKGCGRSGRRPAFSTVFFRAALRARQHDHAVEPLLRLGIRHQCGVERKGSSSRARWRERLGARARSHRPQMGLLVGRPFQHARRHAFRGGRAEIVLSGRRHGFRLPLPPNLLGTKPLQGLLKGPITPTLLSE